MIDIASYDEIKDYPLDEDCTVTLKIVSYYPTEERNMLFINCRTKDNQVITCSGPFDLHIPGNRASKDELVELKNARPCIFKDKRSNRPKLSLKIDDNSTITIINPINDFRRQIFPLTSKLRTPFQQYSGSRSVISVPVRKLVENPKITGVIQNELTFEDMMGSDPDYKYGAYVTTLRLFNGDQIRLIISKKFGNWPEKLLHKGEIISVIGEKTRYYGMDAIFIKPGNHLDVASDDEVIFAQKQPKSNLRSNSAQRKNIHFQ
ncbi:hypothetical protein FO519_009349 [Halicephalobus sp. NKZ332]|nr:hypothetical protein FO519_009349 [Halicephalobus sp. NKZ332]